QVEIVLELGLGCPGDGRETVSPLENLPGQVEDAADPVLHPDVPKDDAGAGGPGFTYHLSVSHAGIGCQIAADPDGRNHSILVLPLLDRGSQLQIVDQGLRLGKLPSDLAQQVLAGGRAREQSPLPGPGRGGVEEAPEGEILYDLLLVQGARARGEVHGGPADP